MKKLQNYFNEFLPQNYRDFRRGVMYLNSNQAVVAELLRVCCEENNVKAIEMAFERIIGKPEKVIVIKRTVVRTLFPDAKKKSLKPTAKVSSDEHTSAVAVTDRPDAIIVDEANAPGMLLQRYLDKIGGEERLYSADVIEDKDAYTVAEVLIANLYLIAIRSSNLAAIRLLFDYLDGAVADVVRIDDEDVVELENYADIAPYEAIQGEDGIYYTEREAIR